ncbi:MAG: GatB/YqeY domain-containing protein [Candidatus Cloacimonadales bacterium]|nr:GatB/YqeY domain-containing protein [Candidatus Cloacimonadota bacterium]MDD2650324.1 GatB/YqeY domain-containing protein [Candidatus Cloacimonadota bacterium]MDD3500964.1 GatB/YqeY domain-containing protein [Candidatus Cloacimonadota bacterium]MDX9976622.1 GatB/YqeY domain-containing protein [Candidatus Cloacimonadales bacterium]
MFTRINNDIKEAMRQRDTHKLEVLRILKSEMQNKEIELKKKLTDAEIISLIQKAVKSKEQANVLFHQGNRDDLVEKGKAEIDILRTYLPIPLTEDELSQIIDKSINDLDAKTIKEMGAVIKAVKEQVGSRADGSIISSIVKQKLS